jgi:hypothetical protein
MTHLVFLLHMSLDSFRILLSVVHPVLLLQMVILLSMAHLVLMLQMLLTVQLRYSVMMVNSPTLVTLPLDRLRLIPMRAISTLVDATKFLAGPFACY